MRPDPDDVAELQERVEALESDLAELTDRVSELERRSEAFPRVCPRRRRHPSTDGQRT